MSQDLIYGRADVGGSIDDDVLPLDGLGLAPHRFVDVEGGVGAVPGILAALPSYEATPNDVFAGADLDDQQTGASPTPRCRRAAGGGLP